MSGDSWKFGSLFWEVLSLCQGPAIRCPFPAISSAFSLSGSCHSVSVSGHFRVSWLPILPKSSRDFDTFSVVEFFNLGYSGCCGKDVEESRAFAYARSPQSLLGLQLPK